MVTETTFKGEIINRHAILKAFDSFDGINHNTNNFRSWLEKDSYKYAVEYEQRLYPPKHILSQVSGIAVSEFSGGEMTNRVFAQLGFQIVDKPDSRASFLMIWNPARYPWSDVRAEWQRFQDNELDFLSWSCSNTRKIKRGDLAYLMRVGSEPKGIIAAGIVVSDEPYEKPVDHMDARQRYVDVKPFLLLDANLQGVIDPTEIDETYNWTPQRSGVEIPERVAIELRDLVDSHTLTTTHRITETYTEGQHKRVSVTRYERDRHARDACLQKHGTQCMVCDFDFGTVYGEIGEGFIHVHHKKPISSYDEKHPIKPTEDLVPVCPNCHAMLHKKNPPYSVQDLKDRIAKNK